MRFLADENFPKRSVVMLRTFDHDVVSVAEWARGSTDRTVLAEAYRDRRVLLTFDRDFGELVFRLGLPTSGIVLIRYEHLDALRPARLVLRLIEMSDIELLGFFTTIAGDEIRQRRIANP
jgi:predicted nuclease of predicted toxin-antitoxin system